MATKTRIGTAGWSIPRAVAHRFPTDGSGLQRYAAVFDAVEVNSSFYRPHRRATWARWAESVPAGFRFSAKLPRAITHERRLVDCAAPLDRFLNEFEGLGDKRGPIVIQTPGSLAFDFAIFTAFVDLWRSRGAPPAAWEPRHGSWFTPAAEAAFTQAGIARIAADPAPKRVDPSLSGRPGGWPGLFYQRLHGSPRMYVSPYDAATLAGLASESVAYGSAAWIMFDNTMSGAAADNALSLKAILDRRVSA